MKSYNVDQLCYFARYVVGKRFSDCPISLQTLLSYYNDWIKSNPSESCDRELNVDEQLDMDFKICGQAYYTIENGKKKRIDPLQLIKVTN